MTPAVLLRGLLRAGRTARQDALASWAAMGTPKRATTALLVFMIVAGVVLRTRDIEFPPSFTFDEHFYPPTSQHFLLGIPDLYPMHPPLSMYFGAIGHLLFDYTPLGWRFIYYCFGLQTMVIGYWVARETFQDKRAGWLAAGFMAADGFFLAYCRSALGDQLLTCLILWFMLAVVTARTWRGMLVAAVLLGVAISVKWSAAMAIIPAVAAVFVLRRAPLYTVLCFAVVPFVHAGIWMAGLWVMGHPADVVSFWHVVVKSVRGFVATGKQANPLASPAYTWIYLYHPIVTKLSLHGATTRYTSSAGNPVFWFPASLCAIGLPIATGVAALRASWRRRWFALLGASFVKPALVLALGWAAMLSMWLFALGKHMFFYHYMPSYGFVIVLLAGCAAKLERHWPGVLLGFVVVAIAVAIWFVPVWCEFPLTLVEANRRLIFHSWRP
jgi:dolichyl-phosphate-mannose--protein O-mannosyl transferase